MSMAIRPDVAHRKLPITSSRSRASRTRRSRSGDRQVLCGRAQRARHRPADAKCVPLDIFNGIGSISPAMLNYIGAEASRKATPKSRSSAATLTGDLGAYGIQSPFAKNPVAISFGSSIAPNIWNFNTDHEFSTNDLYGQGGCNAPDAARRLQRGGRLHGSKDPVGPGEALR